MYSTVPIYSEQHVLLDCRKCHLSHLTNDPGMSLSKGAHHDKIRSPLG